MKLEEAAWPPKNSSPVWAPLFQTWTHFPLARSPTIVSMAPFLLEMMQEMFIFFRKRLQENELGHLSPRLSVSIMSRHDEAFWR